MDSPDNLPTAYVEFYAHAFAKHGAELRDHDFLFAAAEVVEAVDECVECGKRIINITAFSEGLGEHYLLTDEQIERLEAALGDSGVEVSDDDLCSEHAGLSA